MPKRSVAFVKPPEPQFIKRMKEQIGYQEPDTVETKKQILPRDTDDTEMQDDEKPVIVTLKPGDLTEAEFEREMSSSKHDPSQKIVFSKPEKHDVEESNPLVCSSKKTDLKKRVKAHSENSVKIKNASLLSFNDDEDDDDNDEG